MRINVVGAGPAGLYFAILAKRADPGHDITVWERNPPDATYGWGVVFSEETLSELRDADYPSYLALDESLVRWDAIDIHYRDERLRSRGHGFSAIARTQLLGILQGRAAEIGVTLRFQEEAEDPAALANADLLVGADGVGSAVRDRYQDAFGTTFAEHASKYVWFGTDLVFDVFTFIFRETEHGLFQVHAYPFDGQTSTFIVETTASAWRSAGLDRMGEEESLTFCQQLFADHLGDHKLLSNKSLWSTFVTIRNRSWHHGNVVLAGDAAHTAHFTIGSGTKLAIEDAVALSKAVEAHPGDLAGAFAEYELERQAPVERFQEAALDSAHYFENVSRYLGFAPEQFAFNLLTRSGRITRANLELRDPSITNRVDRWFRGEGERAVGPPPLLAPLTAGSLTIPNRVAVASADDPVAAARLGAGLVVTRPVAVTSDGRVHAESPGLWGDEQISGWQRAAEAVGAVGAVLALRLSHAGRRGATRPPQRDVDRPLADPWPLLAPTAEPYTPRSPAPQVMDAGDRDAVTDAFAAAAHRAQAAGVKALLLDCADGYLLASFLSPLTNPGGFEERLAFPLDVVARVRAAFDGLVGVRLVCDDRVAGGITPLEAVEAARRMNAAGCDLVDVAAGGTVASEKAAGDYRRLYRVGLADTVRNEAGVLVMVGGRITTLDEVSTVVAAGRADLCVLDPRRYLA